MHWELQGWGKSEAKLDFLVYLTNAWAAISFLFLFPYKFCESGVRWMRFLKNCVQHFAQSVSTRDFYIRGE